MFTVKKKPLTPNIIWDSSAGRPLCNFGHKGVLETNDPDLAEKLAAMGHMVTGEADASAQQEQPDDVGETSRDNDDAVENVETDTGQQPEQPEETETADASAQQATVSATKGRKNRK